MEFINQTSRRYSPTVLYSSCLMAYPSPKCKPTQNWSTYCTLCNSYPENIFELTLRVAWNSVGFFVVVFLELWMSVLYILSYWNFGSFQIFSIVFMNLFYSVSRNLGGKLGHSVMEQLAIENMGELCQFELHTLQQKFGEKTGYVQFNIRGTTCGAVVSMYRFYSSSKVRVENLRIWYFATCLYLTIDLVLNYFYGYFKLVKSLEIYTQKSKPGWVILNLIEFNAILGKFIILGLTDVVLYSL